MSCNFLLFTIAAFSENDILSGPTFTLLTVPKSRQKPRGIYNFTYNMYILSYMLYVWHARKKNSGLRDPKNNYNINNTLKRALPPRAFDFSPECTLYFFF